MVDDESSSPTAAGVVTTPPPQDRKGNHEDYDDSTCHILPCNIDYNGMAPTHIYFAPQEHDGHVMATFRGRGLVAKQNNSNDTALCGALLSLQKDQNVNVKASFDHMLDWKHEHHPDGLKYEKTSRVEAAQEWMAVANVVSKVSGVVP